MSIVTIFDTRNRSININALDPIVQRTLRILGWKASNFAQLTSGNPMVVSTKEFQALLPSAIKAPARPVTAPKRVDPNAPTAKERQALARAQRAATAAGKDYMGDFISDYRGKIEESGLNSFDEAPEGFSSDIADGVLTGFPDLDRSPRRSMFKEVLADSVSTGMYEVLRRSGL